MDIEILHQARELLEKANAGLQPELLTRASAREVLDAYVGIERLAAFGVAAVTRKLDDPHEVARATGTSIGRAKETVTTGKVLGNCDELSSALQQGHISLDQAAHIARAEEAAPGSATALVGTAKNESFQALRDKSRKVVQDAEQHKDLAVRQRAARSARSHRDDLGMIHLHLAFEPHIGTPIVNRAEAHAGRLHRAAKKEGRSEPFERHLADAYTEMLSGSGVAAGTRPELVVLVSHGVAKRGWKDVREGELCKIPGVGPVPPEIAKDITGDAFLTGVFFDGQDLRHLRRWTRNIPVEVRVALELGKPPDFDGIKCVDCGRRFRTENDHVEPHVAKGPASTGNIDPRCPPCHWSKTERDRKAGKLKPPDP